MALKKIHEWNTYPAGSDDGGAYDIVERGLAANKITDAFRDMAKQVGARISDLQRASVIVGTVGDEDGKLVITLPSGDTTFSNDYSFVMRFPNDISGLTDPLILRLGNTDFNVVHWVYGTNLNKADFSAGKKYICFVDKANSKIEVFNAKLNLDADAVSTSNIANDAVTADKIADNAVLSGAIADGAVLSGAIAEDAVTADKIADNAVLSGAIADGAVLSGAIAEDAVTADKVADGVIPSLIVARVATSEITQEETLTYTASRTATTQNPVHLRISGQIKLNVRLSPLENPISRSVSITINSTVIASATFGEGYNEDSGGVGYSEYAVVVPFDTYFSFTSGNTFQIALEYSGTLQTTNINNRIWVEELSEVVNLT